MAEAALAELQEAILIGELAPGAPLRLEELARSLDMSISPVREAVRQLESLGLAVHVAHRGARVAELAIDDLRDTYEIRLALETIAVRRAAERFSDRDGELARAYLDQYMAAYRRGDPRPTRIAHAAFHFAIYGASGSERLIRTIRPAWENCERYRGPSIMSSRRLSEHERILEACVRHQPEEAAAELYRHLAKTANQIARKMGAGELF